MSHTLSSTGFRIFTYVHPIQNTSLPSTQRHPKFGSYRNSHHQAPLRGHAQAPISAKKRSKMLVFFNFPRFTYVILQFWQKSWGRFNDPGMIENEWSWRSNFWPQKAEAAGSAVANGATTGVCRWFMRWDNIFGKSWGTPFRAHRLHSVIFWTFLNQKIWSELCQDACVCVFRLPCCWLKISTRYIYIYEHQLRYPLVGGWTNPSEKYATVKMGSSSPIIEVKK